MSYCTLVPARELAIARRSPVPEVTEQPVFGAVAIKHTAGWDRMDIIRNTEATEERICRGVVIGTSA